MNSLSALPVAAVPTGAIPTGAVPTGSIPTGAVPTGAVPTGTVHPAGTVPGTVPPAGVVQPTSAPIRYQMFLPPVNQNLVAPPIPEIPFRTVYSLTVHATLLSTTTIVGIFLTAGASSKTPQTDIDCFTFVVVPYIA